MAWWKITLVVLACVFVLMFVLLCVVANIQIDMTLKPGSYWWNHSGWGIEEKVPRTPEEEIIFANEKRINALCKEWKEKCEPEDLFLQSKDGLKLHALYFKNQDAADSHKWLLCVHGYRGSLDNTLSYGREYFLRGYNVLLSENRTTGLSEGTYIGMGWHEKNDTLLWVNRILEIDSEAQIVLHGESMGCATVLMAGAECNSPAVKCVVADCGYTSVWDEFLSVMKGKHKLLLSCASVFCKMRAGYTFKEVSPEKILRKSEKPALFIHGGNDDFIPPVMSERNFNALNVPAENKEFYVFPGAAHCQSQFIDPERYWKTVFAFTERFVK